MNDLLEEQLRDTYTEHDAGYDPRPALQRLRARSYEPRRSRGLRWPAVPAARAARLRTRAVLASAAALAVAAIVVVAVMAGGTAGVGVASAQQVIARTAAAVTRSANGILHVDAATTYAQGHLSYQIDRWSEQTHPFRYWATIKTAQQTQAETRVGNKVTYWQSKGNRISIAPLASAGQIPDPLLTVIQALDAPGAFRSAPVALFNRNGLSISIGSIKTFSKILTEMSKAPGVTVHRHTSFHGVPAISITAANHLSTLYVKPGTYTPLGFVITGPSADDAETTMFKTYTTVPLGSAHMPNLIKEHPHARVTRT